MGVKELYVKLRNPSDINMIDNFLKERDFKVSYVSDSEIHYHLGFNRRMKPVEGVHVHIV